MTKTNFTSSGLIRDLADYILLRTDTNPSFAETCAAALVATACGPDVIISDVKGDVNFNIFGIVVGGSSISNKTVALDIVREIIRLLSAELEIDLDLPQKFSIEGFFSCPTLIQERSSFLKLEHFRARSCDVVRVAMVILCNRTLPCSMVNIYSVTYVMILNFLNDDPR